MHSIKSLVILACAAATTLSANPAATFTTIDIPGADATYPVAINPAGVITGSYLHGSYSSGFLRTPDGTLTTFRIPGAMSTSPESINPAGVIAGVWSAKIWPLRGFVRSVDGTITNFEGPGQAIATSPASINPEGPSWDFGSTPYSMVSSELPVAP